MIKHPRLITLAVLSTTILLSIIGSKGLAQSRSTPSSRDLETQLTPTQIQVLRATGLRVVVPTSIPTGFRIENVVARAARSRIGGVGYHIFYRRLTGSDTDQCFAIEATSGGVGDIPTGERNFSINHSVFGRGRLEQGNYGSANRSTLLSSWLSRGDQGPFYRFVGAGVDSASELQRCGNISPEEAVKVTESLRYLSLFR